MNSGGKFLIGVGLGFIGSGIGSGPGIGSIGSGVGTGKGLGPEIIGLIGFGKGSIGGKLFTRSFERNIYLSPG